ncbi:MAG: hypothetical protein K2M36_00470, partial [Clostridia bacterium]|nr:hypothetical protein [Clostridia bacterium]
MNKDKDLEPIIAQNPTDTVVVNVGEEITDNTVQKEQLDETNTIVKAVEESENTSEKAIDENAEEEEESLEEITGRTLSPGRIVLK